MTMPELLGFWGMILALAAFFIIGFAVAAIFGTWRFRIPIVCLIHFGVFGIWQWIVLDGVGSKYRLVPWWYLGYWIIIFSVVNLWFIISSFRLDWSKSTGLAFAHFVRKGGFWGNHFSKPDNTKYPGTRHNFWGNCSLFVWFLLIISLLCSRSPWHKDLKTKQKWISDTSKNLEATVTKEGTSLKNEALSFFKEQYKGTNTPIEKALEKWNAPNPVQKYMVYMCPACGWKYDEELGNDVYSAGTLWEKLPSGFICPDCVKKDPKAIPQSKNTFLSGKKSTPRLETYVCSSCGWKYNEESGVNYQDGDILVSCPAGTIWAKIPNTFKCVECGKGKDFFRIETLLPVYPGTWGWLVAFILWTPWTIYAWLWSRRDWTADRLDQFTNWLSSKKAMSVTGTAASGGTVADGVSSTIGKAKPHGASEKTTSVAREIGKEVIAEATVDAVKSVLIDGTRGLAKIFRKR